MTGGVVAGGVVTGGVVTGGGDGDRKFFRDGLSALGQG